jgi:hypothetical protein
VFRGKRARKVSVHTFSVWFLALNLVAASGLTYRVVALYLKHITETPMVLPIPLSDFPAEVGTWAGKNVPIPQNIQRVADNDDFTNRLYINNLNNEWVNVYIAYTAQPRAMLGHRPQVCYVGGGWVHDSTESAEVTSKANRKIPCLIHNFHRPYPENERLTVLNFYIVNGYFTSDENVFSGLGWRTPNIAGDPARYVAQVQISSVLENSTRTAAKEMTDLILDYFPDENGKVKAIEFFDSKSSIVK